MFEEAMRRVAQARVNAMIRLLMGTQATATVATAQEPLTLDKLDRLTADLRAKIGPTPMFLSSELFPRDRAFSVEGAAVKYTCAHPSFWMQAQHEIRRNEAPASPLANPLLAPMFGVQVREIDLTDDMSDECRAYLKGIWHDLIEAVKVAMVDLPEWLRSAPQFTAHG